MPRKQPKYKQQLDQTHQELAVHNEQARENSAMMRRSSAWIVGWAALGAFWSVLQIHPLFAGGIVGATVFIGGIVAWVSGWLILEITISVYISFIVGHYFFTASVDPSIERWMQVMIAAAMALMFFVGYWGFREMQRVYTGHYRKATHNTARLQSRLVEHRQAYAQRTTKSQRYRNKSGSADFTENEWLDLCFQYDYTCLRCGKREPDVMITPDHIVALARGGTNTIDNIQPLCLRCNTSKNAKHIDYREGK